MDEACRLSAAPGLTDRVYADIRTRAPKDGLLRRQECDKKVERLPARSPRQPLEDSDVQFLAAWQFIFTHLATTHCTNVT